MGIFIGVEIDAAACAGISDCGQCVRVCPVGIFRRADEMPAVDGDSEDECTLCDLCLQACKPHAISIHKLYEQ